MKLNCIYLEPKRTGLWWTASDLAVDGKIFCCLPFDLRVGGAAHACCIFRSRLTGLMVRVVRLSSVVTVSLVPDSSTCMVSSLLELLDVGRPCVVLPGGIDSICIVLSYSGDDAREGGGCPSVSVVPCAGVKVGGANMEAMGQS